MWEKGGFFFPASGVIRNGKLNRWYFILPYLAKYSLFEVPDIFYFIRKIAYVVKKRISALAGSFFNRFWYNSRIWKFGPFSIFCINEIFWNFKFLDPNFHFFLTLQGLIINKIFKKKSNIFFSIKFVDFWRNEQ